jgi:hypothetical protein
VLEILIKWGSCLAEDERAARVLGLTEVASSELIMN